MPRIPTLALAWTCFAAPCFAGVLHVGPAGSGAPYQQIQHAINAAQPGDTILVQAGTYSNIYLSKPLRLIGAGSGQVVVGAWPAALPTPQFPSSTDAFTNVIVGLPHLTETFISGFEFRGSGYVHVVSGSVSPSAQGQLRLSACEGTVVLDDVLCRPSSGPVPLYTIGLQASNCADLRVQHSSLEGEPTFPGYSSLWTKSSAGLDAFNCTLAISTSTVRGGSNSVSGESPAYGLSTSSSNPNSRVTLDDVQVFGGSQAAGHGHGVPAVLVDCMQPVLVHGSSTLLRGSDAPFGVGGVGLYVSTDTAVELDPSAQLSGGLGAGGAAAAFSLQPGATLTTLPVAAATLSVPSATIPGGGNAILDLHAEPHTAFILYASAAAAPALTVHGFSAAQWIFPQAGVLLAGVVLGPSGQHSFAFPTPTGLPAPIVVHVQGISASSAGLMLSNPQTLSVL